MKTEKIFAGLFIISLCLHFFNVLGNSLLLIFCLVLLAFFCFPLGFYFFSDQTLKRQNIALSILGGIALFFAPIGILFKLMNWPGHIIVLMTALVLITILLAITFMLYGKHKPELGTYYKNYLTRIIFWLSLSCIFYLTPRLPPSSSCTTTASLSCYCLQQNLLTGPDNAEYEQAIETYHRLRQFGVMNIL